MDSEALDSELRSILAKYCRRSEDSLSRDDHIIFDLAVDGDDVSFDLIPELERRFDFEASDDEWARVATVSDLYHLVVRLRGQHRPEIVEARQRRSRALKLGALVSLLALMAALMAVYFVRPTVLGLLLLPGALAIQAGLLLAYLRDKHRSRADRRAWRLARARSAADGDLA